MLRKLKQTLKSITTRDADRLAALLDQLDDPIARRVEWSAASSGGTNFRTHRLVEVSPLRAEFRLSIGALLFCALFFIVGLGVLGIGIATLLGIMPKGAPWWITIPFGLVFASAGAGMWWYMSRPRVFDMQDLWYWRGKRPTDRNAVEACKHAAPLDRVHAIQFISEHCRGDDSSYYSYEINLVLHDAARVNVIDHGNLKHIRKDAQTIANLIGVPVWDATA